MEEKLTAAGQHILAETQGNDETVIASQGTKSQTELLRALSSSADDFVMPAARKEFEPWKWRGYFSDAGQGLTLASSKFSGQSLDASKLTFASLGLAANWVNKTYGAQKEDDPHRLAFIEEKIKTSLEPYLTADKTFPDLTAPRAPLRQKPPQAKGLKEKTQDFISKYSVRFDEIGLRYLGSVAMVLSISQLKAMGELRSGSAVIEKFTWGRAWEDLKKESLKNAYGLLNENKTNLHTGSIYLAGRTLNFIFSKTPDPDDQRPKTALDTFREKYAFRLSSMIEAFAAGTLAVGSFKANNATGKRDWLGGIGGASLMAGLITRIFAPFGLRKVNKEELYAYAADSLASMPKEQLPQLLADTSMVLHTHLKDEPESFGQYFTILKDRLYRDHGIALATTVLSENRQASLHHASRQVKPATSYAERIKANTDAVLAIFLTFE